MSHSPPESPEVIAAADRGRSSGDERDTPSGGAAASEFTRTSKPAISHNSRKTRWRLRFIHYPRGSTTGGTRRTVTAFIPDGGDPPSAAIVFHSYEDAAKYEDAVRAATLKLHPLCEAEFTRGIKAIGHGVFISRELKVNYHYIYSSLCQIAICRANSAPLPLF